MELKRLAIADGSWPALTSAWADQCKQYHEDFTDYSSASVSMLGDVCGLDADPTSGTYGLIDSSDVVHAICFLNLTHQKGFMGKVLRVLNLVLSPYYDFEDLDLEDYSKILSHFFAALVACSNDVLVSQHIKLHYRSPYDRHFFAVIAPHISGVGQLATVESKGMWLSITKK